MNISRLTHNCFESYRFSINYHYYQTPILHQIYLTIQDKGFDRLISTVVRILWINDEGMAVQSLFPLLEFDYPVRFLFLTKKGQYKFYGLGVQNCTENIMKTLPESGFVNSYEIGLSKFEDNCPICNLRPKNVIVACDRGFCLECFYKLYWFNALNGYCNICRTSQNWNHFTIIPK